MSLTLAYIQPMRDWRRVYTISHQMLKVNVPLILDRDIKLEFDFSKKKFIHRISQGFNPTLEWSTAIQNTYQLRSILVRN